MQDEITKHTKKIYNEVKNPKHSFGEKVKEVFVEIFIIVFAVTLSIWLHSWSEHRHQQKEVKDFLVDLKNNLKEDVENMKSARDTISKNSINFSFLQNLTKQQYDSLNSTHFDINLNARIPTTVLNNGDYEGFKSSGKIGYIEDKKLKNMILSYYEQFTPFINEMDKMTITQFYKIMGYVEENADEEDLSKLMLGRKFKFMTKMFTSQMYASYMTYDQSIKYANDIIAEIDKQIK